MFQVLVGDGPTTGEPLEEHMDVDMISFTGSTETGKRFLSYAADSNMKQVTLECGGKNPAIVMDDASELDRWPQYTKWCILKLGQNYLPSTPDYRIKMLKMPLEKTTSSRKGMASGGPADPANKLGVLIDASHQAKVQSYLDRADSER